MYTRIYTHTTTHMQILFARIMQLFCMHPVTVHTRTHTTRAYTWRERITAKMLQRLGQHCLV